MPTLKSAKSLCYRVLRGAPLTPRTRYRPPSSSPELFFILVFSPVHWIRFRNHLPSTLQTGHKYALYLNLPDTRATLHDNPLYSIRLANMKLWEESTGYNKLCDFIAK